MKNIAVSIVLAAGLASFAAAQSATTQTTGSATGQVGASGSQPVSGTNVQGDVSGQTGASAQTTGNTQSQSGSQGGAQAGGNVEAGASAGAGGTQAGASVSTGAQGQAGSGQQKGSASGSGSASTSASGSGAQFDANTLIAATLNKSLDSKKAKPGDAVEAKVAEDVKSAGKVVIPRGSKLLGRVTQAKARANGDSESNLALAFDRVVLKNGQEMQVQTVLAGLAAPRRNPALDSDPMPSAGGMASSEGDVAGAAGGPLGGIAGAAGSTVQGATSTLGGAAATTTGAVGTTGSLAGSTVGAAGNVAGGATGNVRGLKDLSLQTAANGAAQGSVVSGTGKNVRLESGTQMVLRVASQQQ